jgi:hypothetical protein
MKTTISAKIILRRWALPLGLSVVGIGLVAVGTVLLVRYLRANIVDEDADVENFDVVKNRPLYF